MNPGFDPLQLGGEASLNRTLLPNIPAFGKASGRYASSLLSSAAIREAVNGHASQLALSPDSLSRTDPVALLDRALLSESPSVRDAPNGLATSLGRKLGYLLVALVDGAPNEWPGTTRTDYLKHWTGIQNVKLGGGVMRGELGRQIWVSAREVLRELAHQDLTLDVAGVPQYLALIGAARSLQAGQESALVYDFGGTEVKRGIAHYKGDALHRLEVLPPQPAMFLKRPARRAVARARQLARHMTGIIASDWRQAATVSEPSTRFNVAICSYVRDGQLLSTRHDPHGMLGLYPARHEDWLGAELSQLIGKPASITLMHDGTSAARTYAGQPRAAVIMLGTWLGIGFVPEVESGLVSIADDFEVEESG